MTRQQIVDQANEKDFCLNVKGKLYAARLAGTSLDFPYVWARHEDGHTIDAEINWKQAERIANGTLKQIIY